MRTYKLFKTDSVISTPYGRRYVWYAPELDLCFVHYTPKKSNHSYAVGGWAQVDCGDHNWTKLKETVHTVEWEGPEMTRLEKAKAHFEAEVAGR